MQRYPNFKTSLLSRLFGLIASRPFSPSLQKFVNTFYVKATGVCLKEFHPAEHYKTLNALFTRQLLQPRSFDATPSQFISPCDSFISAQGTIDAGCALQIKGHTYCVNALLSDYCSLSNKAKLEKGHYINFYLSPKDYHRYHVPIDMRVAKAIHIPGKLYPVNFTWLKKVEGLFCENERVILECFTPENKLFYMVFVGALNVGKMCFTFDTKIQTNAKSSLQQCYMYQNLFLKKGDELGRFEMGSTIVMFFEKESFKTHATEHKAIHFGMPLGEALL